MRRLRCRVRLFSLFDSVGSRVMALIVGATLPLATVAAILAWHEYRQTAGDSYARASHDAHKAFETVRNDIGQTRVIFKTLNDLGASRRSALNVFRRYTEDRPRSIYCYLSLLSERGETLLRRDGPLASGEQCAGLERINVSLSQKPWVDPARKFEVRLWRINDRALMTVGRRTEIPTDGKHTEPGYLIALQPVISGVEQTQCDRPLDTAECAETNLWILTDHVPPIHLSGPDHRAPHWSARVLKRLLVDLHSEGKPDRFREAGQYFVATRSSTHTLLVAVSKKSVAEQRALNLLMARVLLIAMLLVVELVLVALAARLYLVDPLEKLAQSVAEWRRFGKFKPNLPQTLPLEIRHMERAFRRATARLDRHEKGLRRAARQQDALIREIHHRVKNNLQIVASLLNLQAKRIKQPEAQAEFRAVRERVRALSTLHRHLYMESSQDSLGIQAFLGELASQIFAAYSPSVLGRVRLRLAVENISVSPDQAVPLALFVTEILTNALRHAFPGDRNGSVWVACRQDGEERILTIEDDGQGFEMLSAAEQRREGIGLQLIKGFASQLGGTLSAQSDDGTRCELRF